MKTKLLSAMFLLMSATLFSQHNVSLSGQVTNPTGDSVSLFTYEVVEGKYKQKVLDKTSLNKEGQFELKAKIDSTIDVTFSDGNENAPLILSPNDKLNISFNTSFFDETIRYTGVGSDKNNAIMALYLIEENMNNKLIENIEGGDTTILFTQFDNSHANYIALVEDYKKSTSNFSAYANNILSTAERNKKQIKNYVASEIQFASLMGKIEGQTAIDFEGVNIKGKKTKLSDYKGKIIVVDFWATWCGPCKAEFPAYKSLEEKYGEEINFVSVGTYCKEGEWRKMAKDEGFQNNIYLSKEAEKQIAEYQVKFIPRYLVIDENFKLIDATAPRPSSGELEHFWEK